MTIFSETLGGAGPLSGYANAFTQFVDAENAVLPQKHLIRYAPKTQDIRFVLPEMVAIKDPFTLDISYLPNLGSSFVIEIQTYARTGVPNLFLTMCPFSISTDEYVPLNFLATKRLSIITKIH